PFCETGSIIPNAEVNVFPRGIALALIAVGLCAPAPARAQQTGREKEQILWQKLEANVQEVDRHLDGVIGVAILDLATGQKYLLHADEVMPTASSIKIELAVGMTSSACSKNFCPVARSRMATPITPSRWRSTSWTLASSFCQSICSFSRPVCCARAGAGAHKPTAMRARAIPRGNTFTSAFGIIEPVSQKG